MSTRSSTSLRPTRRIAGGLTVVAGALATVLVASAVAANIQGTARADTLRGTARADKLYGKGGNDKLFGLGGADYVNGGPGNDVLTGGPGADVLACGPGIDLAVADGADRVARDCEAVPGLPSAADATRRRPRPAPTPTPTRRRKTEVLRLHGLGGGICFDIGQPARRGSLRTRGSADATANRLPVQPAITLQASGR